MKLESRIIKGSVDGIFIADKSGELLEIRSITLDPRREIISVTTLEGDTLSRDQILVYHHVLNVPGIGYIPESTRVIYKDKDYLLSYGWHTNISNQEIESWYLLPLEDDTPCKTLYKNMIDEINLIHFR